MITVSNQDQNSLLLIESSFQHHRLMGKPVVIKNWSLFYIQSLLMILGKVLFSSDLIPDASCRYHQ